MSEANKAAMLSEDMGDFLRLADGKVVEHWGATDTGMMMQQLGMGEAPA